MFTSEKQTTLKAPLTFEMLQTMNTQLFVNFYAIFTHFIEWLDWRKKDTKFKDYPDFLLAETLQEFFASVKNKKGENYSKSSMVNLRSGLNWFLIYPPNSRVINLMKNDTFQNANLIFKGKIRENKKKGLDTSQPKTDIAQDDVKKLNEEYFKPGLANGNTEVLLHKVFFDIMFHTGRRGKEGLRALSKKSFQVKTAADGKEFIKITFNEVTKKNQGDQNSSGLATLHNNHAIINEQKTSELCPVNTFKHYLANLNEKCDAFFQHPNEYPSGMVSLTEPLVWTNQKLHLRDGSLNQSVDAEFFFS